jgi:glycosyltransferase involved in cell wall biosynthesis
MPKLLFVTDAFFYPDNSGGAQHSSLYLFKSLRDRGWQVELVCGANLRSESVQRAYQHALSHRQIPWQLPNLSVVKDESLGYPCWRLLRRFHQTIDQRLQWLEAYLQKYKPDVVMGHTSPDCPLLNYAAQQGYPSFFFLRSLYNFDRGIEIPKMIHVIANAPFTAEKTKQFAQRDDVGIVLPFLNVNQYRAATRDRRYITFVNPIPQKGVEVAIEVAQQMPEAQFLFIQGKWTGFSDTRLQTYLQAIESLKNVTVWEHQSDMRQVYAVTDILLVPSQFEEAFGRVIVEAQVNRIPVVAANVGGIAYSMGIGGIAIDPKDDVQSYVTALKTLRTDSQLYHTFADRAFQNSQRSEFDPEYQVDRFIEWVETCRMTSTQSDSTQMEVSNYVTR